MHTEIKRSTSWFIECVLFYHGALEFYNASLVVGLILFSVTQVTSRVYLEGS